MTQIFRKTSDHLRILTVAGDGGNVETLRTTDEHPFYVQGKGWLAAGALRAGDLVQETDGTWQRVLASTREVHAGGVTVYNIEVDGDHTYFVEDGAGPADAVWVHNTCFRNEVLDRWSARLGRRIHPNRQAHHVVPQNDPDAQDLRDLPGRNQVDVDDAMNGVPLLKRFHLRDIHGTRKEDYLDAVRARLRALDGQGAEAIKAELDRIGQELFNGTFDF